MNVTQNKRASPNVLLLTYSCRLLGRKAPVIIINYYRPSAAATASSAILSWLPQPWTAWAAGQLLSECCLCLRLALGAAELRRLGTLEAGMQWG